jgi:hypothetical protein
MWSLRTIDYLLLSLLLIKNLFLYLSNSLPGEIWLGKCGWHFIIDKSSRNGISPQTRSYKSIPKDQTVCGKPKYRWHVTHSGAA